MRCCMQRGNAYITVMLSHRSNDNFCNGSCVEQTVNECLPRNAQQRELALFELTTFDFLPGTLCVEQERRTDMNTKPAPTGVEPAQAAKLQQRAAAIIPVGA